MKLVSQCPLCINLSGHWSAAQSHQNVKQSLQASLTMMYHEVSQHNVGCKGGLGLQTVVCQNCPLALALVCTREVISSCWASQHG